ncbi:type II secretion system F family protein [Streptomyces sp. NPDC021354]|uniref:type II secretion system F family protein n=1 Tax=Streptomyces sp. NPDC021354 TaxID=3154793 RepID=UPI003406C07C
MISTPALLCGAAAGLGLALAVRQLLPRRPDLADVLQRTHAPHTRTARLATSASASRDKATQIADRIGTRLLHTPWVTARLPTQDLALLETSPARLLGRCVIYALIGLAIPQWVMLLVTLIGSPLPLVIPAGASLAFAVLLGAKCLDDVRKEAADAREEWRYATASLLQRSALARAADAGAAEALYRVAEHGDGRVLTRVRATLDHARLAGISPWTALGQLGEEIGVPELSRPAQTFALAGEEGATVSKALEAQAEALRSTMLAEDKAHANQATEKMVLPTLATAFVMLIFIGYPAFSRILAI